MRPLARIALAGLVAAAASCSPAAPEEGPVTVTVLGSSGPEQGVPVLFHDAEGRLRARAVTDPDGRATATVRSGAMATAYRFQPGTLDSHVLATVAGLEPGDEVPVRVWMAGKVPSGTASATVAGSVGGANDYHLDLGCSSGRADAADAPIPFSLYADCPSSGRAIAVAFGGGARLAYALAGPAPLADGVTLGPWRTDFGVLEVNVAGAPAGATSIGGVLEYQEGPTRFQQIGVGGAVSNCCGQSPSFTLATMPDAANEAFVSVQASGPGFGGWFGGYVSRLGPLPASPYAVDLATLPARPEALVLAGPRARRVLSWALAAAPAGAVTADATVLDVSTDHPGSLYSWTAIVPPGATRFTFPELPADLDAALPPAGTPSSFGVQRLDLEAIAGYRPFVRTLGNAQLYEFLPRTPDVVRGVSAFQP